MSEHADHSAASTQPLPSEVPDSQPPSAPSEPAASDKSQVYVLIVTGADNFARETPYGLLHPTSPSTQTVLGVYRSRERAQAAGERWLGGGSIAPWREQAGASVANISRVWAKVEGSDFFDDVNLHDVIGQGHEESFELG